MDDLRKTSLWIESKHMFPKYRSRHSCRYRSFSKCEINENFMGVDPWELDFEDDESGDIERLKQEHKDKVALRKLELEEM